MLKKYKNKFTQENIHAFYKEAKYLFVIDILLLIICWIIYFSFDFLYDALGICPIVLFTVVYLAIECVNNYRIAILQSIDLLRDDVVKRKATINAFDVAEAWFCSPLGGSCISRFYHHRGKIVNRYKLYYLDENNKKRFVRLIMTWEKRGQMDHLFLKNPNNKNIEICYLEKSKVLLSMNLLPGEKYEKHMDRAIFQLNMMI